MKEKVSGVFSTLILRVDLFSWFPKTEKWEQAQNVLLTQYILYPVRNNPFLCLHVVSPPTADRYLYVSFTFTLWAIAGTNRMKEATSNKATTLCRKLARIVLGGRTLFQAWEVLSASGKHASEVYSRDVEENNKIWNFSYHLPRLQKRVFKKGHT